MSGIGNILKRHSGGRTKRSIENDKPRARPTKRAIENQNTGRAGNAGNAGKTTKGSKDLASKFLKTSAATNSYRNAFN